MKILFINSDGAGFADHIEVADGTTVAALFAERMPGRKPEDFLIRITKRGSRLLRSALVECAWCSLRFNA